MPLLARMPRYSSLQVTHLLTLEAAKEEEEGHCAEVLSVSAKISAPESLSTRWQELLFVTMCWIFWSFSEGTSVLASFLPICCPAQEVLIKVLPCRPPLLKEATIQRRKRMNHVVKS